MEKFGTLTSIAAPLPVDDIDTDIIFPARFLLITDREGLGRFAFYDWRFERDGSPKPFVMADRPDARILIAGANFGCGSSREHAVWALHGLGIRCVIAPSFGEIFQANCVKNGVLPVTLSGEPHARLLAEAEAGRELTVDLPAGLIRLAGGGTVPFDLSVRQRDALINGWDEIDLIRAHHAGDIRAFETEQRSAQPWLWAGEPQEH